MESILLQGLFGGIACAGFSVAFNLRGKYILWCALGAVVSWLAYAVPHLWIANDIPCYLLGGIAIAAWAELMARMHKAPVTGFMLIALLILVPGAGIYRTMEYCIQGQSELFISEGLHTLGIAGALATGVFLASATVRLVKAVHRNRKPSCS